MSSLCQLKQDWKLAGAIEGRLEGMIQGKIQGIAEGKIQGKIEGIAEGKREIIQRLLSQGMPKEQVAYYLNMTIAELNAILCF